MKENIERQEKFTDVHRKERLVSESNALIQSKRRETTVKYINKLYIYVHITNYIHRNMPLANQNVFRNNVIIRDSRFSFLDCFLIIRFPTFCWEMVIWYSIIKQTDFSLYTHINMQCAYCYWNRKWLLIDGKHSKMYGKIKYVKTNWTLKKSFYFDIGFNHFTRSKVTNPLTRWGLLNMKEYEENIIN